MPLQSRPSAPSRGERVVAVDGGIRNARKLKWKIDALVGDFDSAPRDALLSSMPVVIGLKRDKDRSDTYHAMRWLHAHSEAREWIALGFEGGRVDHQLALWLDLAQLMRRSRKLKSVRLERASLFKGPGRFRLCARKNSTLSVFALGEVRGLSLRGFKFSARSLRLLPSSHGLSNVAVNRRQTLSLKQGVCLVISP